MARKQLETQAAEKVAEETAPLKQAAESASAKRQQEREKNKALTSKLAMARRDVETQAALSRRLGGQAAGSRKPPRR